MTDCDDKCASSDDVMDNWSSWSSFGHMRSHHMRTTCVGTGSGRHLVCATRKSWQHLDESLAGQSPAGTNAEVTSWESRVTALLKQ